MKWHWMGLMLGISLFTMGIPSAFGRDNDSDNRSGQSGQQQNSQQSNQQNAVSESEAREFVQQHDNNNDGYLSKQEVPSQQRNDFDTVDRNNDGYLSQREIRERGGQLIHSQQAKNNDSNRNNQRRSYSQNETASDSQRNSRSDNEQSWSEWWNSWWSNDSNSSGGNQESAQTGAREFVRRHDKNGDGKISRSEMPNRMADEFQSIDENDDRMLSESEIRNFAMQHRNEFSSGSRSQHSGQQQSGQQRTPANTAYVWVIEVDSGRARLEDLQEAYRILSKTMRITTAKFLAKNCNNAEKK